MLSTPYVPPARVLYLQTLRLPPDDFDSLIGELHLCAQYFDICANITDLHTAQISLLHEFEASLGITPYGYQNHELPLRISQRASERAGEVRKTITSLIAERRRAFGVHNN